MPAIWFTGAFDSGALDGEVRYWYLKAALYQLCDETSLSNSFEIHEMHDVASPVSIGACGLSEFFD